MSLKNNFRYISGFLTGAARQGRAFSLEFQHAAQLQGIAGEYRYPGQRSRAAFEHEVAIFGGFHNKNTPRIVGYLQKTWDELVALNPELKKIRTEGDPKSLRHGIFGAASRFNPDDIHFFVELQKRPECAMTALLVHEVPLYKKLSDQIEMRTGLSGSWVASPETLLKIFEQVKDRPIRHMPSHSFGAIKVELPENAVRIAKSYIDPVIRKAGLEL